MGYVRCYNNGIVDLPPPMPNQDTSLIVHPLMTYNLYGYPEEYVEGLMRSIESDWRVGRQIVFMLQTPDAQRYWKAHPSVTEHSRRFARHNVRAATTLEEARDYLTRHLPLPLIEESGYLVSTHADPTKIKINQLVDSLPLDEVLSSIRPTHARVHGELFYPNQRPSRNCYGCVNNVVGILEDLGFPYEIGTVFSYQHRK